MRAAWSIGSAALLTSACLSLGSSEDDSPPADAGTGGTSVADGSWLTGGNSSGGAAGTAGTTGSGGAPGGSGGTTSGKCSVDADCDDKNPCTNHFCTNGACAFAPTTTDDGNPCTLDSCDPVLGVQHAPKSCDDGNACTTDSCNPSTGCVNAPKTCDDKNECTVDTCAPATGCSFTAIAKPTTVCGTYCNSGFFISGQSCLVSVCSGACTYGYNRVTCSPSAEPS
ncbi:MAG: hypothetical protein IPI67_25095 [Myxococcales bacterium]|nr:hypothetical protein [Myxococcales bacterium]